MNKKLTTIKKPINVELKIFKEYFKKELETKSELLNHILRYIIKNKGKELRPILLFLSAKLISEVSDKTYVAATLVELLHTATLTHDDVVDNSQIRRSVFSVKALWKAKLAVLVGDYMLAQGLKISVKNKAYDILEIVSHAVQEMSEGELLQIEKARRLNITEQDYYQIIQKKTAALIIASCKAGLVSVDASDKQLQVIEEFATKIGIAFQIKDDLFDYENTNIIGKPTGNDIQESKMTLPIIYSLNISSNIERKKIMKILKSKTKSQSQIKTIQNFVKQKNGLSYSNEEIIKYSNQAKKLLLSNFPETEARDALIHLVDYIISRKK